MAYQRKAETILQDENCFKVYIVSENKNNFVDENNRDDFGDGL